MARIWLARSLSSSLRRPESLEGLVDVETLKRVCRRPLELTKYYFSPSILEVLFLGDPEEVRHMLLTLVARKAINELLRWEGQCAQTRLSRLHEHKKWTPLSPRIF